MSKVLEMANGTTSLTMDYEIELEYLFDVENMNDTNQPVYQEVQTFVEKFGQILSIEIEVCISGGYASYDGIEEITSEKTLETIQYSEVPTFLIEQIEKNAEWYAEENGLESFLWE